MLELLVGLVAGLLVLAGILVMMGPKTIGLLRRVRSIRRPRPNLTAYQSTPQESTPSALNPKTQRVLVAATRLANWLRTHNRDDLAREIRSAAGRLTGDEPAGLYAMQTALRRIRSLSLDDRSTQERLGQLAAELRTAVQDRFEQLELLPFRKP